MTDLTPNKICRYRCVKEQASPDYVRGFTFEELQEVLTKLVQLEHIINQICVLIRFVQPQVGDI